ncbi:MAG: heparinase II/III family protein [Legionellales bacterium]|nr:heparinase II/III family protein [Legionellales bacterium]
MNIIYKIFFICKQVLIVFCISFLLSLQIVSADTTQQVNSNELLLGSRSLKSQRANGFKTRENQPGWPLDLPLDWGADPYNDRDWQFLLHSWRMTDPFIVEYFKTGEASLIEEALAYAVDWHDFHYIQNKEAYFSWDDFGTGMRALRLAFFIDLIQRKIIKIDINSKEKILFLANEHIKKLKDENFFSKNNHGIFAMGGLHLLCSVYSKNPACNDDTNKYIERNFRNIFDKQFTEEGVHTEGAPGYHFYISEILNTRLRGARRISSYVNNILEKTEDVKPWLVFPNKVISRVGDTLGTETNTDKISFESLKSIQPTCIQKNKCFLVGDFTKSGYAIVRSIPDTTKDQSMIFVTGMAHNIGHKHADDLSFQLFEFGRFIFIDSGAYADQLDSMNEYALSLAAHNTISIQDTTNPNNLDQQVCSSNQTVKAHHNQYEKRTWGEISKEMKTVEMKGSFLKPIRAMDNKFIIHGKVDRKNLFSQERYISYVPGETLFIEDTLLSSKEHNYTSSLHLASDLHPILVGSNTFIIDLGNNSLEGKLLSKNCKIFTARGQKKPLLGRTTVKYLEMTPTTVVQAICPGKNRKIRWEIVFHKNNAKKCI